MLELKMDDCLTRGDSSQLVSLLHYEGLTSTTLTTLDQLVTKELSGSGFSRVLVVLRSLEILSENRDDLQTLINHGLITKVLSWFEAVRDLLTSDLQKSSAPPLSLTEGFYDYFLLLGQSSLPVSQLSVVLLQLALSALEPKVVFALRLEAIRTFNSILESLSRELRKLIQNNQNLTLTLSQVAEAVLTVGDYELQVSLSEALCRLTPRKDRQQRANQWFSSPDISNAFCDIRDGDFEVDCRRFLNFVNSCHGDDRRVYTFPCRRAFLDSTELFRPKDDKLDEFWIDFNLDSRCVSFFIDEPQSSPRVTDSGGTVQVSPSAARSSGASYSRKKPQSKSQLKILPLSSPSSEEDSSVTTTPVGRRAEFLFDQIRHSTPTYNSGVPVGAELEISQVQAVEFDGSGSLLQQEVFSSNRKRAATDSGYLSGQTEGPSAQRRKAEPQSEKEESASALPEWPREGAEPSVEDEGLIDGGAEPSVKREEPVNEPESDLTSGITTAFKAFKAQLEQHFTSCWQKLEAEVLLSLKECQQHISSLLTAVHQHRLVLLQSFENSITDQLSQLEENSASLNSINAQILSFFQSEMQRLGSFCEEQHQRLKSLEKAESGEDRLSSQ
ncbi:synaptonemal complex protein 2-like isoform X4 [Thunnus maccoyii]|uniref:synaptonemal complex protein 2-like isoform X4 n=1 Tax=Thunnus maccoyii TaxID=8240 RepID=UPI001C4B2B3F|nr:synaptonemal complex protein 2-like isoform X4 [Thunnus maccoyii]